MVVDFVEAKYVHATVMSSHFDVAISGSVPLIHDFDDVYPTLAPIKTSRRGSESRMRLNLNTHVRVRPRNKPKRVPVRCSNHTQCRSSGLPLATALASIVTCWITFGSRFPAAADAACTGWNDGRMDLPAQRDTARQSG